MFVFQETYSTRLFVCFDVQARRLGAGLAGDVLQVQPLGQAHKRKKAPRAPSFVELSGHHFRLALREYGFRRWEALNLIRSVASMGLP